MEQKKASIIGFVDHDGCVRIKKDRNVPYVVVPQSMDSGIPPELEMVKAMYGGVIYRCKKEEGKRQGWELGIHATTEVKAILRDWVAFGVLKRDQAKLAIDYMEDPNGDRDECYKLLKTMKEDYTHIQIDDARLTDPYLAGFFAADGCVAFYVLDGSAKLQANIPKKSCKPLLHAVKTRLGYGAVGSTSLVLGANQSMKFFTRILPFLFGQKREQVSLALEYQSSRPKDRKKRTHEQTTEAERVAKRIKELKKT